MSDIGSRLVGAVVEVLRAQLEEMDIRAGYDLEAKERPVVVVVAGPAEQPHRRRAVVPLTVMVEARADELRGDAAEGQLAEVLAALDEGLEDLVQTLEVMGLHLRKMVPAGFAGTIEGARGYEARQEYRVTLEVMELEVVVDPEEPEDDEGEEDPGEPGEPEN
jgi:hypothetical protein